jgi:DNA-binding HxlR family transcriptional regulator
VAERKHAKSAKAQLRAVHPLRSGPTPRSARGGQALRGLAGRGESAGADRLIHERVRLAIVSALAVHEKLTFNELKEMLDTTDGNLSVHARKLEEAELIGCTKTFEGRMPKTEYRLTASGRRALERYLEHMEALIRVVRDKE